MERSVGLAAKYVVFGGNPTTLPAAAMGGFVDPSEAIGTCDDAETLAAARRWAASLVAGVETGS